MATDDKKSPGDFKVLTHHIFRQLGRILFLASYLCIGALIFQKIENDEIRSENHESFIAARPMAVEKDLANYLNLSINSTELSNLLIEINGSWRRELLKEWEVIDGLKFCWATVTTIGYGHIVPITDSGKMVFIIYSFIGIPLCIYVLAATTSALTNVAKQLVNFVEKRLLKRSRVFHLNRKSIALSLVSFVIQLLCMAGYFTSQNFASFSDGIYYWFTTYTTIGFGDLKDQHAIAGNIWFFIITCWLHVFGLGTLASIMQIGNRRLTMADGRKQKEAIRMASSYLARKFGHSDSNLNRTENYSLEITIDKKHGEVEPSSFFFNNNQGVKIDVEELSQESHLTP